MINAQKVSVALNNAIHLFIAIDLGEDVNMIFVYLALACVLLSLGVCIYSLYNNTVQKSAFFNLLNLAILMYLLGNFVEAACQTPQGSMVGAKIGYLGLPFVPALWCLCIFEFCGINMYKLKYVLAFMLVPAAISILAFTWQSNHLLFTDASYLESNQYGQLRFVPGPLYFIKPLYFYLVDLLGIIVIWINFKNGTHRFKQQAVYFFISALIPVLVTNSYLVETDTSWFNITPYGTALASLLFLFAHNRYGLKNSSIAIKNRVIDGLHEGIIIFDPEEVHVDSNKVAKQIFPELAQVRLGEAISEMDYLPFSSSTLRENETSLMEYSKEIEGLPRTYNLSIARMTQDGRDLGYCVVTHNITALKSVMGDLEARAYTDSLTGLFNRSYFFEKANMEVQTAKQSKSPLSVIMFDLDHFKKVNDTYGHACGDYVLKSVAALAGSVVRKTDILARYGGEEFCILLSGTDLKAAVARAERIRQVICDSQLVFEGQSVPVTSSFGVAELDPGADDLCIENLLKHADAKLYTAKENGRNRVEA